MRSARGSAFVGAAVRCAVAVGCGALTCGLVGWDGPLVALLASLYTLGEAGLLQRRQRDPAALQALGNLPLADVDIFDQLFRESVSHAIVVPSFAAGCFGAAAVAAGCSGPLAVALAVSCALLLWVVVLAGVTVLVAALPRVPLTVLTALTGAVSVLTFHPGSSHLSASVMSLPAGWVVRLFVEGCERGAPRADLLAMVAGLAVVGRLNFSWLRARYQLPDAVWRRVPAELVFDYLVREEAGALVRAGVQGSTVSEGGLSDVLRQRATRNVEVSIRDAVASGRWREAPRPRGFVEQMIFSLLTAEQRQLAPFVAPMGRGVTEGLVRAALVCVLSAFAAALQGPALTQGLAFAAVTYLCLSAGRQGALASCILRGALPVDALGLMWTSLRIGALRVALWMPFLLFQAGVAASSGVLPDAVALALRFAVIVLALQPLGVALQIGGGDEVSDGSRWRGLLVTVLAASATVVAAFTMLVIAADPLASEAPLAAGVTVLSLAAFVVQGWRLESAEPA